MPVDLSPYFVTSGEKPASSSKQNNMITAIQNGLNAVPPSALGGYPSDASKFLDGSGNWRTPGTDLLARYVKASTTDVVNTITATDLFGAAFTVAGGLLPTNGAIKIFAGGDYLNSTGSTTKMRLRFQLGATTLWEQGATSDSIESAAYRRAWWFQAVVQAMGSTAAQQGSGLFMLGRDTPAAAIGVGFITSSVSGSGSFFSAPFLTAATSVNMASAQTLSLMLTHSTANASLSMRCQYARVEVGT
jgi:hypothetical protein